MKQETVSQNESSRGLSWFDLGGLTLLAVGLVFMAVNLLGMRQLENWWSGFILLPGLLFLGVGRTMWGRSGRTALLPRLSTGLGLVITTVAAMFALNLSWNVWWPLMIVVPGVAFWLLGGAKVGVGVTAVLRFHRWLAVTMLLLGFTFLADQLNMIDLSALFGSFHWWGFFILLPGIGAFFEGWRVLRRSAWASTMLLMTAVWIVSSGLMELLAPNWLSWEGMVGVGLIGTGLLTRGWLFLRPGAPTEAK